MKARSAVSIIFKSGSPADTLRLAGSLAGLLKGGEVLSLKGMIGAGKTFFVKGLAAALGSKTSPVSASFNLMRSYKGVRRAGLNLYHFDLFRVSPEETANIGLEDYLGAEDGVTAIEWASCAEYLYGGGDFLELDFELAGGDAREIRVRAQGARAARLLEGLKRKWLKN
ncbi:MAG: tRNA (adenosine(37)-N6)-threonylcarbamoyltransferase complex ATPase subunit type 1 TsaE [Elusimicrobiales bacterium]|jgi:tRNA threonylcarbamoyladenosine biosynthesis protein TsaE